MEHLDCECCRAIASYIELRLVQDTLHIIVIVNVNVLHAGRCALEKCFLLEQFCIMPFAVLLAPFLLRVMADLQDVLSLELGHSSRHCTFVEVALLLHFFHFRHVLQSA